MTVVVINKILFIFIFIIISYIIIIIINIFPILTNSDHKPASLKTGDNIITSKKNFLLIYSITLLGRKDNYITGRLAKKET